MQKVTSLLCSLGLQAAAKAETLVEDKRSYDACVVFMAAATVQWITPWPLDCLLLPGAVAYWYVQSGQSSFMLDYTFKHASTVAGNMRHILKSVTAVTLKDASVTTAPAPEDK